MLADSANEIFNAKRSANHRKLFIISEQLEVGQLTIESTLEELSCLSYLK